MKSNLKFFKGCKSQTVDKFFQKVLYDKKFGYYSSNNPFGKKGDFVTSPIISRLFSEMIAIWIISTWEKLGKPKNLKIVELGPGDGSMAKVIVDVFKKFPSFDSTKNVFLYETSSFLKKIQKDKIKDRRVKWIKDFSKFKKGPIIFFGNEFFDAIPIKQFSRKNNSIYEKYFVLKDNFKIQEKFKIAKKEDIKILNSFKIFRNLSFIEFPKLGLKELSKITNLISKYNGCILLIDYGYLNPNNQNTLQSVIKNKKNNFLKNLGKADVTSHVNFALLKEFFLRKKLNVKKVITQKEFLKNLGILNRAEILARKMKFRDQVNLYLRLKRLLSPKLMGELFKVILAFKFKK